jgi:hypothetical protein
MSPPFTVEQDFCILGVSMGKVKRERNSVTVTMEKEEFNSVIERLGHDPTRTDYSIVCEHIAVKVGMEKAVRIVYEENGLLCFNFVPNLNQYLKEHYMEN